MQKNGIPMEEEEEEEEESLGNDGTANGMEAPQVGRGPQTTGLGIAQSDSLYCDIGAF